MWRHRDLIRQLARREVLGRYQGSVLGLAWSFLNPLLMLAVYTFVFSVVFKARWNHAGEESRADFAIVLFTGMIVYGIFSECVNRAPGLIVTNPSFVKKVVFPLEVLPVVTLGAALFHALIGFVVLAGAILVFRDGVPVTAVALPVVLLPLLAGTLGLSWILASLGVFLRDVSVTVSIFTTVLMFLSPIFYPISALPAAYQGIVAANPIAFVIEQARRVLVWGQWPDWGLLGLQLCMGLLVAWVGFWWFQKTRKGFADVL